MKFRKLNENGPIELDFLTDDDGNARLGVLFNGKHFLNECIRIRNNPWVSTEWAAQIPDYIHGFWYGLNGYFMGYVDEDISENGSVNIYELCYWDEEDEESAYD